MTKACRTLVLCDDTWHPGKIVKRGLSALSGGVFAFEFPKKVAAWSVASFGEFRLVVLAKSNAISSQDERPWLTPDSQAAPAEYVRQGNGLVVIHSGIAGYEELPKVRALMGGAFRRHPPQCPVTIEPEPGHPLTDAIAPFTVRDEPYLMDLDDPGAAVFLRSRSEHGVQPAGWTRTVGEGRVCVLTPGHNVEVWLHPYFQAVLRNALRWAAKL